MTKLMREIKAGTWVGRYKPDPDAEELVKKYKLDGIASAELARALQQKPPGKTNKQTCEHLDRWLQVSNQPSARVMQLLKKLRDGIPLGEPSKNPAPGSWLDWQNEKEKEAKDKEANRSRSRSR